MAVGTLQILFGLVLVLAFLLLVSLVVSAGLAMFAHYADRTWGGSVMAIAATSAFFSFTVIASMFAVIYKTLPDAPLSWRDVWIGAGRESQRR